MKLHYTCNLTKEGFYTHFTTFSRLKNKSKTVLHKTPWETLDLHVTPHRHTQPLTSRARGLVTQADHERPTAKIRPNPRWREMGRGRKRTSRAIRSPPWIEGLVGEEGVAATAAMDGGGAGGDLGSD